MSRDEAERRSAGFFIRPATNADETAIRRVLRAVRSEYGVHQDGHPADASLDDIERNYVRAGGCFQVVEDATGRIVGCAALYPLSASRVELCKMYLEKPARSKGLGKRLLEDLLAIARRNGFAEVWLETNSTLTEAITLYRSYGFQPVEPGCLPAQCDQAYLLKLPRP